MNTRNLMRLGVTLNVLLLTAACASRAGSVQTDRNLIAFEELESLPQNLTLRHVIERRRPQWLNGRGQTSFSTADPVIIYFNLNRSAPDVLDRLRSNEVRELHFLDAMNATQRFGTGHRSGAIMITSR